MTEPKITQAHSVFAMSCWVEVNIRAKAERIWGLLTDAKVFPSWNSTVTGIEGHIREGERLRLRVPGTDCTFTPTVSGVVPNQRMTWIGGFAPMFKGVRTFELKPRSDGSTDSRWRSGSRVWYSLMKGSMPDFGPVFEAYAGDLKRAAEGATS